MAGGGKLCFIERNRFAFQNEMSRSLQEVSNKPSCLEEGNESSGLKGQVHENYSLNKRNK
jgi:hypothetical protein